MKIDWKTRFSNKTWTISFVTLIITFVYQILGVFEVVPKVSESMVLDAILPVLSVIFGAGIIVDGTTNGFNDNE